MIEGFTEITKNSREQALLTTDVLQAEQRLGNKDIVPHKAPLLVTDEPLLTCSILILYNKFTLSAMCLCS